MYLWLLLYLAHPLPLAASWEDGRFRPAEQFSPAWQLDQIRAGRHLLPSFGYHGPNGRVPAADARGLDRAYYDALTACRELGLPLVLKSTQWEASLYGEPRYFELPLVDNPCWIDLEGRPRKKISPFGPVEVWRRLGREWTDTELLRHLQSLYPDPPWVIMLSNNEAADLRWHQVEQDRRYLDRWGPGRSDEFKRQVTGDGYIERYRALLEGLREGAGNWREKLRFIGYGGGVPHVGRWDGWLQYSLAVPGRLSETAAIWDGCSPSLYVNDWQGTSDDLGYAPLVELMNLVWQKEQFETARPGFWFELSTWYDPKWRAKQIAAGQAVVPERYRGFVLAGMWLLKPRAVRDFYGWTTLRADSQPWFEQVLDAVDEIHAEPILREFWQTGQLVVNETVRHPYQSRLPEELRDVPRWYHLTCSTDPWRDEPRDEQGVLRLEFGRMMKQTVPVWALAQVLGEAPRRRWLVYAHAPRGDAPAVTIEVPGWGRLTTGVRRRGSYVRLTEGEPAPIAVGAAQP